MLPRRLKLEILIKNVKGDLRQVKYYVSTSRSTWNNLQAKESKLSSFLSNSTLSSTQFPHFFYSVFICFHLQKQSLINALKFCVLIL